MPGMDGLEFLTLLKQGAAAVPVIMLTAYGAVETYLKSLSLGVFEYVNKPVKAKELGRIVKAALDGTDPGQAPGGGQAAPGGQAMKPLCAASCAGKSETVVRSTESENFFCSGDRQENRRNSPEKTRLFGPASRTYTTGGYH